MQLVYTNTVSLYDLLPEGFEAGDNGCLSGRKTLAGLWPSYDTNDCP